MSRETTGPMALESEEIKEGLDLSRRTALTQAKEQPRPRLFIQVVAPTSSLLLTQEVALPIRATCSAFFTSCSARVLKRLDVYLYILKSRKSNLRAKQ